MPIRKTIAIIVALTALVALGPPAPAAEPHRTTYPLQGKVRGIASVNVQAAERSGASSGRLSQVGKIPVYLRGNAGAPDGARRRRIQKSFRATAT